MTEHQKRSVLIVCDSSGATPHIRAGQFKELFSESQSLRAQFVCRIPEWVGRTETRLESRWWNVPAARALRRYKHKLNQWQEDKILALSQKFDFVYLLRVYSWRLHKMLWEQKRAKVVMDLNDGLWLPYAARGLPQFEEMLTHSHAVVCENEALSAYARQYNSNSHVVPDCPQIEEFDKLRQSFRPASDRVTLGWIGGPGGVGNVSAIFEPLEELFGRHTNLHLRILGADYATLPHFEKVRFSSKLHYSNREMIEEALQLDVGLFPLFRTEDSITRGTLKARMYMSAGVVAVCQDWGENSQLIQHRTNGILARTAEDWLRELEWLIGNPGERRAIAERGLDTIRSSFTRQMCFDRLTSVFESL